MAADLKAELINKNGMNPAQSEAWKAMVEALAPFQDGKKFSFDMKYFIEAKKALALAKKAGV